MKKTFLWLICAGVLSCSAITWVHAADPVKGQQLARQCSVCHGKMGVASDPEMPNIAGQSALYLQKSLEEFRSGVRQDRRMSLMAQNLSDDDIKDLAAWYSSFIVEVSAPE
ncbi:MAG: cytochrome c [Granulosicoccus sp.]